MKRLLVCWLVGCGIALVGSGEASGATIRGTAFDLGLPPQPRLKRDVSITVTGIGGAGQAIPLAPSALRADGTFEVVVNDPNVRAISLFFFGQNDGLQNVRLDRLLNQDQTINISLPNAEPDCPPVADPCCGSPVHAPRTRCRLFRR